MKENIKNYFMENIVRKKILLYYTMLYFIHNKIYLLIKILYNI